MVMMGARSAAYKARSCGRARDKRGDQKDAHVDLRCVLERSTQALAHRSRLPPSLAETTRTDRPATGARPSLSLAGAARRAHGDDGREVGCIQGTLWRP